MRRLLHLLSLAGVVVEGGAIKRLPKTRFPVGLGMITYTRIGDLASNHGSVASNEAVTALQMYTPADSVISPYERCVDEYSGFKPALPKDKIIHMLESFKYEVCRVPKSKGIDEFPAALEQYKIENKLTCPGDIGANKWVRLDCKVTSKDTSTGPFYLSRAAKKPISESVVQPVMRGKDDSKFFKDRIRCHTSSRSEDQQIKECKYLLMNLLEIENARPEEVDSTRDDEEEGEEDEDHRQKRNKKRHPSRSDDSKSAGIGTESSSSESLSTGSIALIVAGCVFLVAGGVAMHMYSRRKSPKIGAQEQQPLVRGNN